MQLINVFKRLYRGWFNLSLGVQSGLAVLVLAWISAGVYLLLFQFYRPSLLLAAFLVSSLLVGIFLYGFYRRIIVRLRALERRAVMLSEESTISKKLGFGDEIESLERSFNRMVRHILEKENRLERLIAVLGESEKVAKMGSWEWDVSSGRMWCSEGLCRLLGCESKGSEDGMDSLLEKVHEDDKGTVLLALKALVEHGEPFDIVHRMAKGDDEIYVRHRGVIVQVQGKKIAVGALVDITKELHEVRELSRLRDAIDFSSDVIFVCDEKGRIEFVNRRFEEVYGWTKRECIGKQPSILKSGQIPEDVYKEMWNTMLAKRTWMGTVINKRVDGSLVKVRSRISPVVSDARNIVGFFAVQQVVKDVQIGVSDKGGVMGRDAFIAKIEEVLLVAGNEKKCFLLFIAPDFLDMIARTVGRTEVNRYLGILGTRIVKVCNEMKTSLSVDEVFVGRISPNEFACFIVGADQNTAMRVAVAIKDTVAITEIAGGVKASASVGCAWFPEHGRTASLLFSAADIALYKAKSKGGNTVYEFSAGDKLSDKTHSRLMQKTMIEEALTSGRVIPYFQPILDLNSMTIHHFEALARLVDDDGNVLSPASFLDAAVQFGLIRDIDRAIFLRTLEVARTCLEKGERFSFAVNLSSKELEDDQWIRFVAQASAEAKLPLDMFVFELTETESLSDIQKAQDFLKEVKRLRARVALDDFGSGYSSFLYLKRLPVDLLKIDGAFIRALPSEPMDKQIVRSITSISMGIGLQTVAEFVENRETLETLRRLGVDFAQGYYVGKPAPQPLNSVEHLIRDMGLDNVGALQNRA